MDFIHTETPCVFPALCRECRFDPALIRHEEAAKLVAVNVSAWRRLLTTRHPSRLSQRPTTDTHSAVEHACHLRRACQEFGRVLAAELPREATADEDETGGRSVHDQDPWLVAKGLEEAATSVTTLLEQLTARQWQHEVLWGDHWRTIEIHANQLLHEMIHRQHLVILSILDMDDMRTD